MEWLQALTPVDYGIIAVVGTALLIGWVRGLVEVLMGFLVFIISAFIAGRYSALVLEILNRMWDVQHKLADVFSRRLNLPAEANHIPASAIPLEKAADWLRSIPIPKGFRETLAQRLVDWSHAAGTQTAADFITSQLAEGVLTTLVFVVMVVLISWGLALLARLVSDQIKEIPLVGTINRLLGAAVLGLEASAIVALVVGLVGPALSMYGGASAGSAIQGAQLAPHFLTLYNWLGAFLFGIAGGPFFIS
ncbi:MAG TPA: CvpA family protein [Symbiobacteriaceae bacterium]|nr:CvpA family protein [Symbiobacteriaceae bacterium]